MKPRKIIRDYTTLAVGSAIMGNVGAVAGAPAAPAVNAAMGGMSMMGAGITAGVGLGVMSDMKKLKKKGIV